MKIGDKVKLYKDQIFRSGHKGDSWFNSEEYANIYTIKKIIREKSSDGYLIVKLDNNTIITTFYLRSLTTKELRKFKLKKINEQQY